MRLEPSAWHDEGGALATRSAELPEPAPAAADRHPRLPTTVVGRDDDPAETAEWLRSLEAVRESHGATRTRYLLERILERGARLGVLPDGPLNTDFVNTIAADEQPAFPGDEAMEKRIRRIIRWNAVALVHRANAASPGIGGHLSTYASSASLYEVGFNHFFRGGGGGDGVGDQIFFQGHSAPGIYARAFLEGRLDETQMEGFRRELGRGLPSYPHPRLLPDFWQFPTVSMGLGPLGAIYQARFNRYLEARGLGDGSCSRVWCFVGDGESDEPETLGSLSLAARERLDNLTFVVNCNLQRLDGPVRGNGKIIQELEAVFRGAGWRVIKVIWGPEWDRLLAADHHDLLRRRMNEVVDGQFQKYATAPGAYTRQDFFGADPRLLELVADMSDEQIRKLRRGGHSYRKLYAAYRLATETRGQPTVVLAHTVKGWTLGGGFEGSNNTHQKKKMEERELTAFRDLLELPVSDAEIDRAPFYHPGPDSDEVRYLLARRHALGGFVPMRRAHEAVPVGLPDRACFAELLAGSDGRDASTTMVFARLLSKLLRDPQVGSRIVPIVPDEARTFGLDALFSQVGIYASAGQRYEPVDKGKLLYYRESRDGQVLEEGITEAGAMASFTAAATSYATHGQPTIPFFIFYSMFGFQRAGDQIWALGDSLARGFLLGATAGRTTLNGEGLQHQDGQSLHLAAAYPHVRAYEITYAYELGVIIDEGMRALLERGENALYYITLQNEGYAMPAMPDGVREGIVRGLYRLAPAPRPHPLAVKLLGSGTIMQQVLAAQALLDERFGVAAEVYCAPSYGELRREALGCERQARLHPLDESPLPYVTRVLGRGSAPVVAASDWQRSVPEQIARFVPQRFVPLGTDGFGLSDTREALRRHFEIDAASIAVAALDALRCDGELPPARVAEAIAELGVETDAPAPFER